jgi:hypothetical protein
MKSQSAKRYPPELRERAVRMLMEHRDEYDSEPDAIRAISSKSGAITTRYAPGCVSIKMMSVVVPIR